MFAFVSVCTLTLNVYTHTSMCSCCHDSDHLRTESYQVYRGTLAAGHTNLAYAVCPCPDCVQHDQPNRCLPPSATDEYRWCVRVCLSTYTHSLTCKCLLPCIQSKLTSTYALSHNLGTTADGDDDNAGAARSHLTVVTTKADVPQTMLSLATLMPFHNTSVSRAHLPSSVAGVKAWSFFQQYMSKGHTSIPSGSNRHLDDGKALMDWFLSMSTPEERKVLLPPTPVTSLKDVSLLAQLDPVVQDAMRKFICLRLDVLVRARLILCYFDARLPCPPLLLSCGGGPNNAPIDDSLSGSAVAQHVKYLRGMGQTALVPVLHNLLEWRRQHQLYTCNPDKVLVLAEVLHRIHSKWTVRTTATKKELVLEGFLLLPEWADKVGGKMRTRPWNARYAVKEDEEWVRQYNAQALAQKADGRGGQG